MTNEKERISHNITVDEVNQMLSKEHVLAESSKAYDAFYNSSRSLSFNSRTNEFVVRAHVGIYETTLTTRDVEEAVKRYNTWGSTRDVDL